MASVYDVANFFVDVVLKTEDDHITNLKLNKLLYYAQGCHLARTGRPLFQGAIEAWSFGPVVPQIYHKYKEYKKDPISNVDQCYFPSRFSTEELDTLVDVMRECGCYTGPTLVNMTHAQGTPWSQAHEHGQTTIDQESMRAYFTGHPIPRFDTSHIPTVDVLPKEWYDPAEDAEWEAYR